MTDKWASEDPLPISLVAHTVFCERPAWLEAMGERVASLAIEEGQADHARVDHRVDDRSNRRRSVTVQHDELGIVGKCDVIGIAEGGLELVEFKSAPIRAEPTVTDAHVVQLALQRMCLEHEGHDVVGQSVHFTTQRVTVPVALSEERFTEARQWVDRTREVVTADAAPGPLIDDPRCTGCSHVSVCLPDEHAGRRDARRITVRDAHGDVLDVTTPGARVSLRQGRVVVSERGQEVGSVPIERVDALVLHGNVDASSALLRELLWRSRTVLWCSWRGKVVGYARGAQGPNGGPRVRQHVASARGDLGIARELIGAKISNQATILRRNSRGDCGPAVAHLRALAKQVRSAADVTGLFGLEGDAAATYFRWLPTLLASDRANWCVSVWRGRHGRGAQDPVNVALNFVYGLLLGDVVRAVLAAGLDPNAGFVHSSGRNKPALALDLMEQFRPAVGDSTVIGAINNGEFVVGMITRVLGDVRLRDSGRKSLVSAYERRVMREFRHPLFGYRVTWRRSMEIQARLVLGVLDGSQERYVGVRVR